MSVLDWFAIKSPEQRAADSRRYDRWAFPYGEAQKQRIAEILGDLLPEERPAIAMAVYLIGREGYLGRHTEAPEELAGRTEEEKLLGGWSALKRQLPGGSRKLLPRYLALILADEGVNAALDYPPVDVIREQSEVLAERLKQLKR